MNTLPSLIDKVPRTMRAEAKSAPTCSAGLMIKIDGLVTLSMTLS